MIISLDIETYGAFERFDQGGRTCPDQTVFNPRLSAKVDDLVADVRAAKDALEADRDSLSNEGQAALDTLAAKIDALA